GDNRGPTNAHPTKVDFLLSFFRLGQRRQRVDRGIVDADDLAPNADRAGNPEIGAKRVDHPLRNARLAVARVAIEKQGGSGLEGLTQLREQSPADYQVGEGLSQPVGPGLLAPQRLGRNSRGVVVQWNRRSAEVRALLGI